MIYLKVIVAILAVSISSYSYALTKEVTIKRSNYSLPLTQVKISDNKVSWSIFKSQDAHSVGLFYLNKADALSLLNSSKMAKKHYSKMIESGRCPTEKIKSGRFGEIKSNGNEIDFEVVCERNNIMVQYVMTDEYAVNIIIIKAEWQDLRKLAESVLEYYK